MSAPQDRDADRALPAERQITREEAARIIRRSESRVRQLYRDDKPLTRYYNHLGRLRLDRVEVEEYRRRRDTFRSSAA